MGKKGLSSESQMVPSKSVEQLSFLLVASWDFWDGKILWRCDATRLNAYCQLQIFSVGKDLPWNKCRTSQCIKLIQRSMLCFCFYSNFPSLASFHIVVSQWIFLTKPGDSQDKYDHTIFQKRRPPFRNTEGHLIGDKVLFFFCSCGLSRFQK